MALITRSGANTAGTDLQVSHRFPPPWSARELQQAFRVEDATGRIIAAHSKRRRRVEFLSFMNSIVAAFRDRELHVILDNLATHKENERWLKPNVHFHFTPTRSSWLNQVETWFSILQGQSLNGASFTAVDS